MENVDGSLEYYAVRSVVEERINQPAILLEWNVVGKLHAINAKKVDPPQDRENSLTGSKVYFYSIADFLENVKGVFDNTFSKDVYEKLGVSRKEDDFSKPLRFSLAPADKATTKGAQQKQRAKADPRGALCVYFPFPSISKNLRNS